MKINYADLKESLNSSFEKNFYDLIIIGSGPAAITLSEKILSTKKKSKILILEYGDYQKKSYKKIFSKYLKINLKSRVFTVGGTSSIWANISSYFEEFEMKSRWSKKKINLWPISHKSLMKEYEKLDKKYQFFFNKIKKKKIDIPFEVRPFLSTFKPINFKQFVDFKKIDLIYNCKIDTIDENKDLAAAYTLDNKVKFNSKKIIVCCGGIESVRLIQNSLFKKKLKNIKNKNLVGKFFMDHPKFDLGYLEFPKYEIINKFEVKKKNNFVSYYGISLKKNIQIKKNLLNTYVRFENHNNKIFNFIDNIKIPIIRNILERKKIFRVRLFCEMMPNIKNLITSKNTKTHVKLKFSKVDYDTINLLTKKIKYFFSQKPEKEVNLNTKNILKRTKDASHHMGGLRFYPNAKESVVDRNLKIIGLKRIYVCSSAVFPTSGSVNPTMTICTLANKLGNHLKKNL
tara:strand:+ start:1735 stop:3105 length:1371 start_codon:yes stop_codon:yes gene_type:complete